MALTPTGILKELRQVAAGLNPAEIRTASLKPLRIGLVAASEDGFQIMERYLCSGVSDELAQDRAASSLERVTLSEPGECDLILCEAHPTLAPLPPNGCRFHLSAPHRTVEALVSAYPDLTLPLARTFPVFRPEVSAAIISRVSAENALFSFASALPNVIPNLFELPWTLGEFATDTAFLTANQIRMALQLAAAHDRPVGYIEQKAQIATIAGGAFGWRALARELAGKIPLAGGLVPKAGIAYAATWVLGLGLERVNRLGRPLTRSERREQYAAALERGKAIAREMVPGLRRDRNPSPSHSV